MGLEMLTFIEIAAGIFFGLTFFLVAGVVALGLWAPTSRVRDGDIKGRSWTI
jgi:hypothetical protein